MQDNPIPDKELNIQEQTFVLLNLFIKPTSRALWTSKDYPKEHAASKRLRTSYPDFSFFYTLQEYYEQFNSLLGLTSKRMKDELDKKYKEFLINKERNKIYKLEGEPIIQYETNNIKTQQLN
jgi:hypothetical protein